MPSAPGSPPAEQLARHAAAFLGFSIPISVALDNVLIVIIFLSWIIGSSLQSKYTSIRENPVALSALMLFGLLAAGLLYGSRHPGEGGNYLGKYLDLALIPVFISLFRDARTRELGIRWFCVGVLVTFVVAELTAMGTLVDNDIIRRPATYPGAMKLSITHGFISAFAVFVFVLLAHREKNWPHRLMYSALAIAALKNVAMVAISRTAYLVLALLTVYFAAAFYRTRGIVVACIVLIVAFAGAFTISDTFRLRVETIISDTGPGPSKWASRESVTYRLEWYRHSLDIVRDHPLLGAGTASFPQEYAKRAKPAGSPHTVNPHNEYLLIAVQTGLLGLALMLNLFWQQLRLARRLASPLETHLARGLVIAMVVGCLFNSFLLDHTEGLFFAWFTGLLFGGLGAKPPPESPGRTA